MQKMSKSCMETWFLNFCWMMISANTKIMAQRTFVFPNFVSDRDGIPHKWKFTLYLMHFVKFVDFHFSQWHRPWVSMPHPNFWLFDTFYAKSCMETWFLLNDDFSRQKMMTQRTFVFPNFVSDHDGIPHKWKFTLYLMHVVKFVDFHFSRWHRP